MKRQEYKYALFCQEYHITRDMIYPADNLLVANGLIRGPCPLFLLLIRRTFFVVVVVVVVAVVVFSPSLSCHKMFQHFSLHASC